MPDYWECEGYVEIVESDAMCGPNRVYVGDTPEDDILDALAEVFRGECVRITIEVI